MLLKLVAKSFEIEFLTNFWNLGPEMQLKFNKIRIPDPIRIIFSGSQDSIGLYIRTKSEQKKIQNW